MCRSLTSTPRGSEGNNDVLVTANLGLEGLVVQHLDIAGCDSLLLGTNARLLGDESRQTVKISTAVVVLGGVALSIEPFEGREALNAESAAKLLVGIGVDLCNGNLLLCKLKGSGQLLVDWGESLAVAAPRGEELDQSRLSRLEDDIIEVVRDEINDGRGGRSAHQGERRSQDSTEAAEHHLESVYCFVAVCGSSLELDASTAATCSPRRL